MRLLPVAKAICAAIVLLLAGCAQLTTSGTLNASQQASFDAHLNLALRYIDAGKRDLANIHLRKAAAVDDDAAELLHGYALLYQMEGNPALASDFYRRAITAKPTYTLAHYNFGALLYREGDITSAREQMLLASSDLSAERRPQSLYILGLSEHQLGSSDAALEAYRKAILLAPSFAEPYLASAQVLFEQRNWQLALAQLHQFDTLAPPTASSLWLEVQLAALLDIPDLFASAGLALRNLFPNSSQAAAYRQKFAVGSSRTQESVDVQ